MKKNLLSIVIGLFLIVGLCNSGFAAVASDWYISLGGSKVVANEYLSFSDSPSIVIGTPAAFENYGVVSVAAETTTTINGGNSTTTTTTLYGEYLLTGSNAASVIPGYSIGTFTAGGDLNLYVDTDGNLTNDTLIATLTLTSGTAWLGDDNGYITLCYKITALYDDNYLFWSDDSSMEEGTILTITTNALRVYTLDDSLAAFLQEQGITYNPSEDILLASGGQIRASAVPVPSALILLGTGLIGFVGFRRKNM